MFGDDVEDNGLILRSIEFIFQQLDQIIQQFNQSSEENKVSNPKTLVKSRERKERKPFYELFISCVQIESNNMYDLIQEKQGEPEFIKITDFEDAKNIIQMYYSLLD